jgi:hypothetical protein
MLLFPMAERKLVSIMTYLGSLVLTVVLVFGVAWNVWPELSDADHPELRLEGIVAGGFYQGQVSVTFSVKDKTTAVARIRLLVDDADLYDKAVGQKEYFDGALLDTGTLSEGEHHLTVSVMDSSLWKQLEERTIPFRVDRTPPVISVALLSASVFQGGTCGLVIRTDEPLSSLRLERGGKTYDCSQLPGQPLAYRGLLPVSPLARPADFAVSCVARDRAGNVATEIRTVSVRARPFVSEQIELPKEKQGILSNTSRIRDDRTRIAAALEGRRGEQLWRGRFKRPAPGIDSSAFGTRRVYETGGVGSWHHGIDIANKEGTPVRAANSGLVLLAEELFLTGNTVILDHGQGVVSYYFHMSRLEVKKGEAVAQDGLIGLMGTTGLSTGSHCHWELQVHDESVDPDDWVKESFEPAG